MLITPLDTVLYPVIARRVHSSRPQPRSMRWMPKVISMCTFHPLAWTVGTKFEWKNGLSGVGPDVRISCQARHSGLVRVSSVVIRQVYLA